MFFRFTAALVLVVLISMLGIRLEQETLRLQRSVSRQYYQTDLLLELHAHLRLNTQRLTAPSQLAMLPSTQRTVAARTKAETTSQGSVSSASQPEPRTTQLPLLKFQRPYDPEGID